MDMYLIGVYLMGVYLMSMVCLEAFGFFNLGVLGKKSSHPTIECLKRQGVVIVPPRTATV